MLLKEWIEKENITLSDFAKEMGISRQSLYKFFKQDMRFSLELSEKISNHTQNQVSIDSLRDEARCETCGRKYAKKREVSRE